MVAVVAESLLDQNLFSAGEDRKKVALPVIHQVIQDNHIRPVRLAAIPVVEPVILDNQRTIQATHQVTKTHLDQEHIRPIVEAVIKQVILNNQHTTQASHQMDTKVNLTPTIHLVIKMPLEQEYMCLVLVRVLPKVAGKYLQKRLAVVKQGTHHHLQ